MKKTFIIRWLPLALLLMFGGACQRHADSPAPAEDTCRLLRIDYSDGGYDSLAYNAQGQISAFMSYYVYPDGGRQSFGGVLTYNNEGLLVRNVSIPDGITPDSTSYEQFTYTNGALATIDLYERGQHVYRFDITTNIDGQIIGAKGKKLGSTTYPQYTAQHTLDSRGHYIRSEAMDTKGIFIRQEASDFDPTIKSHYQLLKGWPVNVMLFWYDYGNNTPIRGSGVFRKSAFYHGYDENNQFVGLQKRADLSHSYQLNRRQYVTEMTTTNLATTPASVYTTRFTYTNCNE